MEQPQQQAIDPQVLLQKIVTHLRSVGVECRVRSEPPTEVNGQLFQTSLFQAKDVDGNWVNLTRGTIAIDAEKHLAEVNAVTASLEATLDQEAQQLQQKRDNLVTIKAEAEAIKATLQPYIDAKKVEEAKQAEVQEATTEPKAEVIAPVVG